MAVSAEVSATSVSSSKLGSGLGTECQKLNDNSLDDHLAIRIPARPWPFEARSVMRGLWSVRNVKCLPHKYVLHFSVAHTHPRASFLTAEYFLSVWVSVCDAKATAFSEPS